MTSCPIRFATVVFMAAGCIGGAMAAENQATQAKEAAATAEVIDPVKVEATMSTPPGYHKTKRKGKDVYCKRSAKTGSILTSSEVCLTAAEVKTMREASQEARRDMQAPVGDLEKKSDNTPAANISNGGY